MKDFFLRMTIAIMTLFTIPLCIIGLLCATALWPILFMMKLIDLLFNKEKEQKASNKFEEFIFVFYGLCILCLIFPFDIIMN